MSHVPSPSLTLTPDILTFQIRQDFEVFVGTKYTRLNHLSKKTWALYRYLFIKTRTYKVT